MSDTQRPFDQLADSARLALARGDTDGARSSLDAALRGAEADGSIATESAESLVRLGVLYQEAGLAQEAERLYGDAAAVAEATLRPNDPALAVALSYLGTSLATRGEVNAAEPLLTRALHISEQRLGMEHPDLNGLLNVLSRLYLKQSAFARAEPLLTRLLSMKLLKGEDHPEVATVLGSLVPIRQGVGDHEGAEQLARRVLHIREKTLAPNHYAVASALELLAESCAARGKVGEAGRLFQRALSIREQTLGVTHASLRVVRERIADLQMQAAELTDGDEPPASPLPYRLLATVADATPVSSAVALPNGVMASLPPSLLVASSPDVDRTAPPRLRAVPQVALADAVAQPVDSGENDELRQQALVLPVVAGSLSLHEELKKIEDELNAEAAARGFESPFKRASAAITAVFARPGAKFAAGAAVAVVLLVSAVGLESRTTASAPSGEGGAQRRPPSTLPARNAPTASPLADSLSPLIQTASGSIAPRPTSSAKQSSGAPRGESRGDAHTRKSSDPTPALEIAHPAKLAAPTIALGRADSIARASEAPAKIGDGWFSRQFWTAGIDKRAGSDAASGPTAAKLIGEMPHPVYPEFLRKNSVEGEVVVKFVVDVTGHPDMSTLEVVRSPHDAMTNSVRRVVEQLRFEPARIAGPGSATRTELVQISFVFQVAPK